MLDNAIIPQLSPENQQFIELGIIEGTFPCVCEKCEKSIEDAGTWILYGEEILCGQCYMDLTAEVN